MATPAATHYAVVRQCLQAGKDVFVEKPLALNAAQGRQLVALAKQRSRILMVGHILLYHPAVTKLRQLIIEGALGRILVLLFQSPEHGPDPHRGEHPLELSRRTTFR